MVATVTRMGPVKALLRDNSRGRRPSAWGDVRPKPRFGPAPLC